jgi:DNA polymerase-1
MTKITLARRFEIFIFTVAKSKFMANKPKLFLIDAFAIIYRAYFAFGNNQRYNSKGLNTSTTLGFTNTLLDVLNNIRPSHIGVVFDAPGDNFRNEIYPEYKANREAMPEDIRKALPYVKKVIEGFNIPIVEKSGYEADDVIGTVAKKAEKEGYEVYLMTPDKDFAQLVTENILLYRPGRSGKPAEVWGIEEVKKKFEVLPEQVIDILGMWGDAVDNIPGIPGIGEKTSKKLVNQYGSVEGLIEHAEELKGKQKENVINFAEQGLLSKKLATIEVNVPVDFELDTFIHEPMNKELLKEVFAELEFRTLSERVLGEKIQATTTTGQTDLFAQTENEPESSETLQSIESFEDKEKKYFLVEELGKVKELVNVIANENSFCMDTETTGLDSHTAEIVGISVSWKSDEAYYIAIPEGKEKEFVECFTPVFSNESIELVGQNIKYDINILKSYGVEIKNKLFDTMIAHYLLQPDLKHNMDFLSETYLNYRPISIEELIGKKGKNQKSMRELPASEVKDYACEDADITWQLKQIFEKELEKVNLKSLFTELEMPLIHVLSDMELAGVSIDTEALKSYSLELEKEIDNHEKSVLNQAGIEFNVGSPKQLGEVLFDHLKIVDKPKKTKSGQYQTNEETLQKLADKHPIVKDILEFRQLKKLKSTYVDALPELINPKTNKIHTSFNQAIAATGRLSSTNPNLQNIPIKTERGREVRKAFIASEGNELLAADYSQVELRLMAEMSQDEGMMHAFQEGLDIHSATASKVFDVPIEEVDREMRSKAKMVNFGIIYGISAFGLSERLGIPRKEAKEIIDNYFKKYPKVSSYMSNCVETAKEKGYVETIMGRRRYLKDINSRNAVVRGYAERNAINAPVQGSAADIIKKAMIDIQKEIKSNGWKSKMILQVHDELLFDTVPAEKEALAKLVKEKMQNAIKLSVPLEVDMNFGESWLEAH